MQDAKPANFDDAVRKVADVLAAQQDAFLPWGAGDVGQRFAEGFVELGRHFRAWPPEPSDVEAVVSIAGKDFYAFVALDFLSKITPKGTYPALDRWSRDVYLGIDAQPQRRKGASRNKFLSRDILIVGQIEGLKTLGIDPTRSNKKKPGRPEHSGCDAVSKATALCRKRGAKVLILEYGGVEQIWKRRGRLRPDALSPLLTDMLDCLSGKLAR